MKTRWVFIRDASVCPTGVAQQCPDSKKKTFKKGTIVWGEVYENSVEMSDPPIQGYALNVEEGGGWEKGGENWDIPLPPLSKDSPVVRAPILVSKGAIVIYIILVIAFLKYRFGK